MNQQFLPISRTSSQRQEIVEAIANERAGLEALYLQFSQKRIRYSQLVTRLSPIHGIPDEILSRIFLDENFDISFYASQGDLLTIRLTCKRWNQVALDTPRLWSRITTHDTKADECPTRGYWSSEQLSTRLLRSKNVPIDIDLREDWGDPRTALLMAECHRCRSLDVDEITETDLVTHISSMLHRGSHPPDFPNLQQLERLNLRGHHEFGLIFAAADIPGFHAPALHTLQLSSASISIEDYACFVSATPCVTRLVLDRIQWEDVTGRPENVGHSMLRRLRYDSYVDDTGRGDEDIFTILRALLEASPTVSEVDLGVSFSTHQLICDTKRKDWIASQPPISSVQTVKYSITQIFDTDFEELPGPEGYNYVQINDPCRSQLFTWFPNVSSFGFSFPWMQDKHRRDLANTWVTLVRPRQLLKGLLSFESINAISLKNLSLDLLPLARLIKSTSKKNPKLMLDLESSCVHRGCVSYSCCLPDSPPAVIEGDHCPVDGHRFGSHWSEWVSFLHRKFPGDTDLKKILADA